MLTGEVAVVVMSHLLDIHFSMDPLLRHEAVVNATRRVLGTILMQGVLITFPADLLCEQKPPEQGPADVAPEGDRESAKVDEEGEAEAKEQRVELEIVSLLEGFAKMSSTPIPLGRIGDSDKFTFLDGPTLQSTHEEQTLPSVDSSVQRPDYHDVVVKDVGPATVVLMSEIMCRSHGVLWNGALGVWEDERCQQGTRGFMTWVEKRLTGNEDSSVGEEEEEEQDAGSDSDGADDDDRSEAVSQGTHGSSRRASSLSTVSAWVMLHAEFDLAVVLGRDSARKVPELVQTPSELTLVSEADGLLRLLRGDPMPALKTCLPKL